MRQRLLSRARALQLPSIQLNDLLQRLHFATQPPAAMGGWLPQLLAQWQMPRRIVRARAQPQQGRQQGAERSSSRGGGGGSSGSSGADNAAGKAATAAAGQHATAQQPLRSIASGRLDAFYGWLPWPVTGLQGGLAFAGWDCEWLPPDRRLRAHLNGSVALVALSAFPGGSGSAEDTAAAGAADAAAELVLARSSSSAGTGGGTGNGASDGKTNGANRWQPGACCSYARIVQAAEAAGATAVLLAAPAGRQPREANCSCPVECSAELSILATMVPHSVGVVLRDVLQAGDRVNVSFEEEQVGSGSWPGVGCFCAEVQRRVGFDSCLEEEPARAAVSWRRGVPGAISVCALMAGGLCASCSASLRPVHLSLCTFILRHARRAWAYGPLSTPLLPMSLPPTHLPCFGLLMHAGPGAVGRHRRLRLAL